MKAWKAYVTATRDSVLLGGVKHHESTPFESRKDAEAFVSQCVRANCEAHRGVSAWGVVEVECKNPIPAGDHACYPERNR